MPITKEHLNALSAILPADEIIQRQSLAFAKHTVPWSTSYDQQPAIALVPSTEQSLSAAIKWLYNSSLDFAIRGKGLGSSSAEDVILSMQAFDKLTFDEEQGIVEIGAGLDWGQVDSLLAKAAPGYLVVGARCPYVGVMGSTLAGGFSWLSHEFGIGSDPQNLLDVRIVLRDGRAIWASEEPDLLWALRGGGGNFGVATTVRLKARPYSPSIASGMFFIPREQYDTVSNRVSEWTKSVSDPKCAMHVFVMPQKLYAQNDTGYPVIAILPFDANGIDHARSEQGFKWLLDIDGVQGQLDEYTLSGVHELQRDHQALHGKTQSWLEAALVDDIDDNFINRACQWWTDISNNHPDLSYGTFALIEIMQEAAFTSSPSPSSTAWPHGQNGRQHVLQLSTGGVNMNPDQIKAIQPLALDILAKAPAIISGKQSHPSGQVLPNFLLPNTDVPAVFGGNWDKLRQIKQVYDPAGRFNKGFSIPPAT